MSIEDVKRFMDLVNQDKILAEKVKKAGSDVEELIQLGGENGCELTADDLKAVQVETLDTIGEGLLAFLDNISKDEELARKLEDAGTDVDEIIRLGKENGCEFTEENLRALQDMTAKSDEELSDEELEKVAGGVITVLAAVVGLLGVGAVALSAGSLAVGYAAGEGRK